MMIDKVLRKSLKSSCLRGHRRSQARSERDPNPLNRIGQTSPDPMTSLFDQSILTAAAERLVEAARRAGADAADAIAVREVTIAGKLPDMFRTLTPANDLAFRQGINAPTVMVEETTVAGV